MRIDLHVHTNRYSACGRSTPEAMLTRAGEVGLDAVVLTEHNLVWPVDECAALQVRFPALKIFRGVEVACAEGDDLLVYGVTEEGLFRAGMPAAEVLDLAHARGGVVVLAHPYRFGAPALEALDHQTLDGVELMSNNILNYAYAPGLALAERLGAFGIAASDAHQVDTLGLWAVRLAQPVADERALAQALRQRAFHLDVDCATIRARNEQVAAQVEQVRRLMAQGERDEDIYRQMPSLSSTIISGIRHGRDILRPCLSD